MNRVMKLNALFCFFLLFAFSSCSPKQKQYLIGGSGWKQISIVDRQGNKIWNHSLEKKQECNSACFVGENLILYSYKQGAKLIDRDHNCLWDYKCVEGAEIQSASITDDGNVLIGECGNPSRIYEFSNSGEKLLEITFETEIDRPHSQFRQIVKLSNGNYLVPLLKKKSVMEINLKGEIVQNTFVGHSLFSVKVLKNENYLLSCGDHHKLLEYDMNKKQIVWELNENDVKGIPLRYVAEAIRLENGNTIICNWGGHFKGEEKVAQVFEIDKNKNLIWKIKDYQQFGNISTIDIRRIKP